MNKETKYTFKDIKTFYQKKKKTLNKNYSEHITSFWYLV